MGKDCNACLDKNCKDCGNKTRKCGKPTEIFSRVCGYARPIKNWNKGKQEEFKDRKVFKV
jgi:ribonucleoside-triphosphate reductase